MLPNLAPAELILIAVVAVLLFGRRLPEVGRTLGKGIVEFKKGIRGLEDEFRADERANHGHAAYQPPEPPPFATSDHADALVPKFEPPAAAPVRQADRPAATTII